MRSKRDQPLVSTDAIAEIMIIFNADLRTTQTPHSVTSPPRTLFHFTSAPTMIIKWIGIMDTLCVLVSFLIIEQHMCLFIF